MEKIFFLFSLILVIMSAEAQTGSWKIRLNGKVLLSTSIEDEKKNSKKITTSEWNKKGHLEISFKESSPDFWKRSFLLFDEDDNQLWSGDSVTYSRIQLSTLRELFKGKKQLRIYTIVTPLDPNIAVRIRRVHLCTLRLP